MSGFIAGLRAGSAQRVVLPAHPADVTTRVSRREASRTRPPMISLRGAKSTVVLPGAYLGNSVRASECSKYVAIEATTTRVSTVRSSIPTTDTRAQASMTMPLSRTRSNISTWLGPARTTLGVMVVLSRLGDARGRARDQRDAIAEADRHHPGASPHVCVIVTDDEHGDAAC